MSFTFEDNKTSAIAVILSESEQKYVFLDTNEASSSLSSALSVLEEKLDENTIQQLNVALRRGVTLKEMCSILTSSQPPEANFTSLELQPDEEIEVLPSCKPEVMFIAGENGCGKSTLAMLAVKNYMELFPENRVFMFLRQEDDVYLTLPEHQEIVFTAPEDPSEMEGWKEDMDRVTSGGYDIDMFNDCLVLLDDMDNLQDKAELKAMNKLMNDLVTNGRKRGIHTIYVSHLLMNYAQTRVILNEAAKVFFFPGCGTRQIETFLKTYGSMKTKQAEAIAAIKSRWVMLSRRIPRYIIHSRGMFMV